MKLNELGRFWRTIRHLKPVQFTARAQFRFARPEPDLSPGPALRPAQGMFVTAAERAPSQTAGGQVEFLNQSAVLAQIGWDDPSFSKLWRYNLHYFDDLNAAKAQHRRAVQRAMIRCWIEQNPPATGSGWEPYPTSLRIVNWVKFCLAEQDHSPEMRHSMAVQARWLTKRLERHLLGNHLFANAKALAFAGSYFEGPEADTWIAQAQEILDNELAEQILDDGGQFELSPMYHALAVEDLLDLINIARCYPNSGLSRIARRCEELVPAMLYWLNAMSHPDGAISFFNDAAFGIAPTNDQLVAYAHRLDIAADDTPDLLHLETSGYARLQKDQALVIADLARIGPDYLPGHAHADSLSFEFSLGAQRVFVNTGTSVYGLGTDRLVERGTAAHNTVIVDNTNSSEVWSGFRVGRRARVHDVRVWRDGATLCAQGRHDGYAHLPGRPSHKRRFQLDQTSLTITDEVDQHAKPLAAQARFHLHPNVTLEWFGVQGVLTLPDRRQATLHSTVQGCIEKTFWSPEFGKRLTNACLVLPIEDTETQLTLSWN